MMSPLPPPPPDLHLMQPHQRKQAMTAYNRSMERYKAERKEHDNFMFWNLAFILVFLGLICATTVGGIMFFLFQKLGLLGPLGLIVLCLAFFLAVAEVKKRL
jgi:uncharacterized membrane protein YozB (DUF420 family)